MEEFARTVKAAWGYRDSAQPAENVADFPFADFETLLQLRGFDGEVGRRTRAPYIILGALD